MRVLAVAFTGVFCGGLASSVGFRGRLVCSASPFRGGNRWAGRGGVGGEGVSVGGEMGLQCDYVTAAVKCRKGL